MKKILFESIKKDLYIEKLYLVLEKVINNFYFGAQKRLPLSNMFWITAWLFTKLYE